MSVTFSTKTVNTAVIHSLKFKNGNNKIISEICSKLTVKTTEQRYWRLSSVFIFNFEQIYTMFPGSIVDFEKVNACWEHTKFLLKLKTLELIVQMFWKLYEMFLRQKAKLNFRFLLASTIRFDVFTIF